MLAALLSLSLAVPGAREMHGLAFRLLLRLKGETFVQGQPPGCIIYLIPNVAFTPEHEFALRRRSTISLNDYALATATHDYFALNFPPTAACTNQTLTPWAALRLAWIASHQLSYVGTTNQVVPANGAQASAHSARMVLEYAQATWPTNGAWWLAEAAILFSEHDKDGALVALRTASTKTPWNAEAVQMLQAMTVLYESAGLPKLDAAVLANTFSAQNSASALQGHVRRQLDRLMNEAVRENNATKLNAIMELLVELRKVEWSDRYRNLFNTFHYFTPSDDLVNAMAATTGRPSLAEFAHGNYEKERQLRREVFTNFLNVRVSARTAGSFFAQTEANKFMRNLRSELGSLQDKVSMMSMFRASFTGSLAVFLFALLLTAICCEALFVWLRAKQRKIGFWPHGNGFWIAALALLGLSVWIMTRCFIALGIGEDVGFSMEATNRMISPASEAGLAASLLCVAWFALWILAWRAAKKPFVSWPVVAIIADVYCVAVMLAGCFREQLAAQILAGWF